MRHAGGTKGNIKFLLLHPTAFLILRQNSRIMTSYLLLLVYYLAEQINVMYLIKIYLMYLHW